MEPTTDKRIVSRREYVQAVSKKMELWIETIYLFLLSGFFGLAALGVILWLLIACVACGLGEQPGLLHNDLQGSLAVFGAVLAIVAGKLAHILLVSAQKSKALAQSMSIDVVPLTRANTVDLPTFNSLVRASEQSIQGQEDVLLRAAAQGLEALPEQLVRAFVVSE